jgi:hypothetical protein
MGAAVLKTSLSGAACATVSSNKAAGV